MYYIANIPCIETDIRHYGILGMKWGERRYQNEDGTLTEAGRARYGYSLAKKLYKNQEEFREKYYDIHDKAHEIARKKNPRYAKAEDIYEEQGIKAANNDPSYDKNADIEAETILFEEWEKPDRDYREAVNDLMHQFGNDLVKDLDLTGGEAEYAKNYAETLITNLSWRGKMNHKKLKKEKW